MKNKIPKYNFKKGLNIEFEINTIQSIYNNSKQKMIIPHMQNFFGIFYFTNGKGSHFVDFNEYPIKKRSISFISNEQVHYFKNIEGTKGIVILFTPLFIINDDIIDNIFEQSVDFPQLLLSNNVAQKFEKIFSLMEEEYKSENKLREVILKKYLEIIIYEIHKVNEKENIIYKKDADYIRFIKFKNHLKKYFRLSKNVKFYADKQFTTTKTLNLSVRKTVGKSAKEFIDEYILICAKRLLINSEVTTKEIAYELGFNEPTNFIKFFKRLDNKTPTEFRSSRI